MLVKCRPSHDPKQLERLLKKEKVVKSSASLLGEFQE